ncbi:MULTISPECIES: hypothetical protein [Desulfovibrio]|uniref:Uncharacterized protein n=1 Tax=Desulfovibrio desulfuricans TaxID=876 RepID=A0AA94HRH5_DESDE|nr:MULTISPECIES: hypothetical protein [Desulfovibrio]ATD82265.1 hypothetical protein CNY67_13385 [Desulfovibrio sp. G11]SFW30088.1 hypothetical protein SAMN02910291_00744 [Desulfovibrio desulfuricans]SPD35027.1 Hypothetical protein DSVG11_0920 [Desulfovibrio sp. G11]
MRQLSLIEDIAQLAGALPAIKAAMRGIAGAPEGEGRKALPDKLNAIARASGVKLTGGNASGISEEMLHKILSPSDDSRPPSVLMLLAYYKATGNPAHLRAMLRSVGLDIMTEDDRKLRDYARAIIDQKKARKQARKLEEEL